MITDLAIAISPLGTYYLWLGLRLLWMDRQARAAIHLDLEKRQLTPVSIRRDRGVWRDCGSASAAFWLLALDYAVRVQPSHEDDKEMHYYAEFVWFVGRLRSLERLDADEGDLDHESTEET